MSNPYKRPRDWLPVEDRHTFGVTETIRMTKPAEGNEELAHRAALRQHVLAKKIRDAARNRGLGIKAVAATAGLHYSTVLNVLNGVTHADLPTLVVLGDAVGLDLKVSLVPKTAPPAADGSSADRDAAAGSGTGPGTNPPK